MNSNTGLIGTIVTWFQHPFNSQGSVLNWILWVGCLIIGAWLWNTVLMDIKNI